VLEGGETRRKERRVRHGRDIEETARSVVTKSLSEVVWWKCGKRSVADQMRHLPNLPPVHFGSSMMPPALLFLERGKAKSLLTESGPSLCLLSDGNASKLWGSGVARSPRYQR